MHEIAISLSLEQDAPTASPQARRTFYLVFVGRAEHQVWNRSRRLQHPRSGLEMYDPHGRALNGDTTLATLAFTSLLSIVLGAVTIGKRC